MRSGLRSPGSRLLLAGVAIGAIATCGDSLTAQDLLCEEAAAQLQHCCAGFRPEGFACAQGAGGCGSNNVDSPEARCILDRSCQDLEDAGVCARAIAQPLTRPICP